MLALPNERLDSQFERTVDVDASFGAHFDHCRRVKCPRDLANLCVGDRTAARRQIHLRDDEHPRLPEKGECERARMTRNEVK